MERAVLAVIFFQVGLFSLCSSASANKVNGSAVVSGGIPEKKMIKDTESGFERALRKFSEPLMKVAKETGAELHANEMFGSPPHLVLNITILGTANSSELSEPTIKSAEEADVDYVNEIFFISDQVGNITMLESVNISELALNDYDKSFSLSSHLRGPIDDSEKEITSRMYYAAAVVQGLSADDAVPIPPGNNHFVYLMMCEDPPEEYLEHLRKGEPLPFLTKQQTQVIKNYHDKQVAKTIQLRNERIFIEIVLGLDGIMVAMAIGFYFCFVKKRRSASLIQTMDI